jgi:hypothetical protein
MTHIARLSTGARLFTFLRTFSLDLRPRTSFEGNYFQLRSLEDFANSSTSLICNSENRLGRGGAEEIKNHAFFRGVPFDNLRSIRAPFEPRLTSNVDTTYFPIEEIDQTDTATHLKAANLGRPQEDVPEMSLPFIGYTFKRFESNFR